MLRYLTLCLCALVMVTMSAPARAVVVTADTASNSAYTDGWQGLNPDAGETAGNDNGGFGFLPWDFDGGFWDPADSPYPAAHFIDGVDVPTSAFNDLGATAFGLTNGNQRFQGFTAVATRPFASPLLTGDIFSMDIDNPILDPVDSNAGASFSVDFQTANGDVRLSLFAFSGFNADQWTIEGLNATTPTGMDDTTGSNGFAMTMEITGAETYEMTITPFGGAMSTYSGSFKRPGFGDVAAVRITVFGNGSGNGASSANGQHELFFDNLMIDRNLICDFEPDGDCDSDDVDALVTLGDLTIGLAVPPADGKFDLNGDHAVNSADYALWLATAATSHGHATPYLASDTDLDRDVDISDFNHLATNFDPGGINAATNGHSKGNSDGDNDVDITDFNTLASNFAPGGYDDAAGNAADGSADADPNQIDLIVDLATGDVTLDGHAAAISGLQIFSAGGGLRAGDLAPAVLQFVIATNPTTYAEGAFANIAVDGLVPLGVLYDVLIGARDVEFAYTVLGQPTVTGNVIYIPEPATLTLLAWIAPQWLRRRRRA